MAQALSLVIAFFPVFVLFWLANQAEDRRVRSVSDGGLARGCIMSLGVLYGLLIIAGVITHISDGLLTYAPMVLQSVGFELTADDISGRINSLTLVAMGLWLPAVIGLLLLTKPVRQAIARLIPIDPDNVVHTVALALSALILTSLMITLGVGLANLSARLAEQNATLDESDLSSTFIAVWVQQILMALLALIGVGWLARRTWPSSLARLGLARPTLADMGAGLGIGLGMIPLVMLAGGIASVLGFGPDPNVSQLTDQLIGPLFRSPYGILTLGLAAALGEETIFRGALQPRFGRLLTTACFAVVHSNYGLSFSTLIVFVVGLVLAWVRVHYNTSVSMIVHAIYNISLGLLTYVSLQFLQG